LTTISYEQKLQKFLSLVLLDNEELENVKTAFSDRIFLSYRKKDRALANLVMSSIHDFPFCRDIAIWYDEYLLFGEDFNDAIFNAMKKSRLFVFCVTDNVVNEKNYIQTTEYPKAKEFMLPVLPIIADTMNDAQRKKLPKLYDGIPESVVLSEKDGLEKHLREIFDAEKYSKKENDPVQCFLIGLAYLNGIEVEVNHPRAKELLEKSAQMQYLPAVEKLAYMYQHGKGVVRDSEKALEWFEKCIELLTYEQDNTKLFGVLCEVLQLLFDADALFRLCHAKQVKKYTMQTVSLLSQIDLSSVDALKTFALLAFVNDQDPVCERFICAAEDIIDRETQPSDTFISVCGFFYGQLAQYRYRKSAGTIIYNVVKQDVFADRRKQSSNLIEDAVQMLGRLYEKNPIKWKRRYADVLAVYCHMNITQSFCDEQTLADSVETACRLYKQLQKDGDLLCVEKRAELCLAYGDYLAYDVNVTWDDVCFDLHTEQEVGFCPEQKIPLDLAIGNKRFHELYDIPRIRKALSMMRLCVQLYKALVERGNLYILAGLLSACHCLARLLSCLADWLDSAKDENISVILRTEILKDATRCYCEMLDFVCKIKLLNKDDTDGKEKKSDAERTSSAIGGKQTEKHFLADEKADVTALLKMEEEIYSRDPICDCYNFALQLADYGQNEEAQKIHEVLHSLFMQMNGLADLPLVIANLYELAVSQQDREKTLFILLDFEANYLQNRIIPRHWQTDCDVFFFFFEIAQCYAQKGVFVQADEYFVKAEDFSADLKASLVAVYKCEWAKCRLYLQDYATTEEMALTGLDILIDVREKLPDEWNALCKVYAEILSATGKKDESVLWLAQML
ncbi:MAG: toll/interleukin-1 receptor domain-containing protein, partial [Clostridia bacterium]|nr:toll/interleukin-1 receptor domain-containing protein [Clostridia bacterium]